MSDEQKIEESHGLWEIAVARLAALVQAEADRSWVKRAVEEERDAFYRWYTVSARVTR